MTTSMTVGSWVVLGNGCPMRYRFTRDEVEFTFGDTTTFELAFQPAALQELVRLGAEALAAAPSELGVSPVRRAGR